LKIKKLNNGMTLISVENPSSSLLSLQIWVNCGSVYEGSKEKGLSHFIEHLLFKGSKDVLNIASNIEALGGDLNAFTSLENTCYYINIPKSNLDEALLSLKQLVFDPIFDKQEINNERAVIIEEINRSKDLPTRVLSDSFFKIHFNKHNYAYPVLGFDKIINKVTKKEILNYYNKYYHPKNCVLIVSGNFKEDKNFLNKLNTVFASSKKTLKIQKLKQATPNKKFKISINKMDIKENYVLSGFSIPNFLNKDIPALDVLSTILAYGESSRLYQSLRNTNLVNSVYSGSYTPRCGGFFSVSFAFNEANDVYNRLSNIFNIIYTQLTDIVNGNLKETEIQKAINLILSEKIYELETVDSIGKRIGYLYALSKDINFDNKYYEKLKKVSYSDLSYVIKKYFKFNNLSVALVVNKNIKIEPKKVEKILKTKLNPFKLNKANNLKLNNKKLLKINSILNFKYKYKEPSLLELGKGVKLILQENKTLPLFSLKIGTLGGLRFEKETQLGAYNLCSRAMLFGAEDLSYKDIINELDFTASTISAFSGRNSFGFSLECINAFTNKNLALLDKIILKPNFEAKLLEVEKNNIIEEINSIEDNLSSYLGVMLLKTLYKKHPYRFNSLGTVATIKSFDQKFLKNFYSNIFKYNNLVISAVGDFDKTTIINWSKNLISSLNIKNDSYKLIKEPVQIEKRFYKKIKDAAQSHIALSYRSCNIKAKDALVLKLIYSVLSGQSGRLFLNLRDKKSLAYTVCPIMMFGLDEGYFGAYIACEYDKEAEAIASIRKEFSELKHKAISEYELKRAKNYLLGSYVLGMQRYQDMAFTYAFDELYGLSFDYYKNFEKLVNNISYKDILSIANKYFKDESENLVLLSKK